MILSRGCAQCRLELAGKIFHGYLGTQTALQYILFIISSWKMKRKKKGKEATDQGKSKVHIKTQNFYLLCIATNFFLYSGGFEV